MSQYYVAQGSDGFVNSVTGTTNEITASPTSGAVVVSIPSTFIAPGSIKATTLISTPELQVTGTLSGTISVLPQANAGTYNFNLPTTPGTAGYLLTSDGGGSGGGMTWTAPPVDQANWVSTAATSQACLVNTGYVTTAASQQTMYLPATAAFGSEIKYSNLGAGFTVQPPYGQTVNFLTQTASYPSNLQTTASYAALDIVCASANTTWNVVNNEGTYTQGIMTSALSGGVGDNTLVYIKSNGTAWGCGYNADGPIGNLTLTNYSSPVATVGGNSYIQIATAFTTTIALRGDGTAWTWGDGQAGALGNNTTTNTSSPVSVVGNFSFVQVATSSGCGAGLTSTGQIWSWGENDHGEIGNLTLNSYSSPVSVVGNHSFIQVVIGASTMHGLKATGDCWSWGGNTYGELGNQTVTSYSSPISVVGNHSFIQISAGAQCTYGLKIDGSCWGWGDNQFGNLGNQTTTSYSSPVSVVGAHSFIQIASGIYLSCYGLKANGQIWCWGNNGNGQLAQQNTISYSSPVSVVGGFSFFKLLTSGFNSNTTPSMAAWTSNGQIWAWGSNTDGMLGNNSTTATSSPVLVLNTP